MGRRLPSLNALRAFEAAARHLSFTKAAEELAVTPAAVSHQIKTLEEALGVVLFRRLTRAVVLSEAAQAALPALRDGFDKLAEASEHLRGAGGEGVLTLSVPPSFGAKWLVPRLDGFRRVHPALDVRISAIDRLVDFRREGVDAAVRYGTGHYPGLRVDLLFGEVAFPVCSPDLLQGSPPLRVPADLHHHTLLHVDWKMDNETAPNWRMWLLAARADEVDPSRGPRFNLESMALQAAIEGQGVTLGIAALVAGDLGAGRLVKPFDLGVSGRTSFSYYFVCPESVAQ